MIDRFIDCIPPKSTAQGSTLILKRADGTPFVGRTSNSRASKVKKELFALLKEYAPEEPFDCPIAFHCDWIYPWRASEPKKNREKKFIPCDRRPDNSNILKLLEDTMTRCGYWVDDSRIADTRMRKFWGNRPGIRIRIYRLGSKGKEA